MGRNLDAADELEQVEITENELLSMAAHELKTPLSIIRTLSQCLEDEKVPAEVLRQLERITSTANKGLSLVNSIMELEHIKHSAELIDSEPVNLIQVTQDVLHQLQPQLKDRQQTVRIYERTMLPIYTDERYVRQIVLNLIDNAGKYSEDGKPIEVRFRSDPNYQFVRVRDYGVGVNRREWGRLFQQFGQINQPLSANATSNGLGLYVCKQLSQVLGGELSLQSKHIGSCFVLQLPVMRQSSLWKASSW